MSEFDNNGNQPYQGNPVPPQQPPMQPPVQPPMAPMPPMQPQAPQGGVGLSVTSMVLGILSLLLFCWWTYVALAVAIIGLILGIVAVHGRKAGRGMAIAGIVTSAIALALVVIVLILAAAGLAILGSSINELENFMQQYNYYNY